MNKTLKWILIIIAIALIVLALKVYLNYQVSNWTKGFVSESLEKTCSDNICKMGGADYGVLNNSNNLCVCYKNNQVISSTKIMNSS